MRESCPRKVLVAVDAAGSEGALLYAADEARRRRCDIHLVHVAPLLMDGGLDRDPSAKQVFPDRAPWNVRDFTLAEIKQLDAGSWFAPEFAGERVPTLAEWVNAVGQQAGMLLEPKTPELYPGIETDLDKELRSLPAFNRALKADRVVVQSFNHAWLRIYKDLAPDVPVGLLYGNKPTQIDIATAATWAQQINPALGAIDKATVDQVHAHGMEIHVWTVNAGTDMRRAINWHVDGIITNYPQVLRDILRRT